MYVAKLKADQRNVSKLAVTTDSKQLSSPSHATIPFILNWDLETTALQTCSTNEHHNLGNMTDHLKAASEVWAALVKVCDVYISAELLLESHA